jgi:hypothetical protein
MKVPAGSRLPPSSEKKRAGWGAQQRDAPLGLAARLCRPVGQGGIAAVPTSALDPPHSAASPAVPALIGSGSPSRCFLQLAELLKFSENFGMTLSQVADHTGIAEKAGDVTDGQDKVQVISAIILLNHLELAL